MWSQRHHPPPPLHGYVTQCSYTYVSYVFHLNDEDGDKDTVSTSKISSMAPTGEPNEIVNMGPHVCCAVCVLVLPKSISTSQPVVKLRYPLLEILRMNKFISPIDDCSNVVDWRRVNWISYELGGMFLFRLWGFRRWQWFFRQIYTEALPHIGKHHRLEKKSSQSTEKLII